jgi:hypothetical protein
MPHLALYDTLTPWSAMRIEIVLWLWAVLRIAYCVLRIAYYNYTVLEVLL